MQNKKVKEMENFIRNYVVNAKEDDLLEGLSTDPALLYLAIVNSGSKDEIKRIIDLLEKNNKLDLLITKTKPETDESVLHFIIKISESNSEFADILAYIEIKDPDIRKKEMEREVNKMANEMTEKNKIQTNYNTNASNFFRQTDLILNPVDKITKTDYKEVNRYIGGINSFIKNKKDEMFSIDKKIQKEIDFLNDNFNKIENNINMSETLNKIVSENKKIFEKDKKIIANEIETSFYSNYYESEFSKYNLNETRDKLREIVKSAGDLPIRESEKYKNIDNQLSISKINKNKPQNVKKIINDTLKDIDILSRNVNEITGKIYQLIKSDSVYSKVDKVVKENPQVLTSQDRNVQDCIKITEYFKTITNTTKSEVDRLKIQISPSTNSTNATQEEINKNLKNTLTNYITNANIDEISTTKTAFIAWMLTDHRYFLLAKDVFEKKNNSLNDIISMNDKDLTSYLDEVKTAFEGVFGKNARHMNNAEMIRNYLKHNVNSQEMEELKNILHYVDYLTLKKSRRWLFWIRDEEKLKKVFLDIIKHQNKHNSDIGLILTV